MPLCTVHLLALHHTTLNPVLTFLSTLQPISTNPLVISRVIRWIIRPTKLSTEYLLSRNISWDLFLILPDSSPLPPQVETLIEHHWTISAGVPSRLIQDFESKNEKLLKPERDNIPALPLSTKKGVKELADSSQDLVMSTDLDSWIETYISNSKSNAGGAVSMFNLLSFRPNMKEEYFKYGAAFAQSVGTKFGGNAKIVGNVVPTPNSDRKVAVRYDAGNDGWNEIALAHYPSILHFRAMLLDEEYQRVNHEHRVGSLRDTCILMTSEIDVLEMLGRGNGAKL